MDKNSIQYPRRGLLRSFVRVLGRLVLPLFFRLKITGIGSVPSSGPLIVVGNHSAIMEVVMMVVYMPRQVEILGSIDVPHEPFLDKVTRSYGYIPYKRGRLERQPLRQALSILNQGGILGIFPEGGIWQINERRIQPGVAWLSEKTLSPVLPVYFHGTSGALNRALRLERPQLNMTVGEVIPPAVNTNEMVYKVFLKEYATRVMDAVYALRPSGDEPQTSKVRDERFSLQVEVYDQSSHPIDIPEELKINNPESLAKFLHYPTILKIFKVNYRMPIDPLQKLSSYPKPKELMESSRLIIEYLEIENPYLLTYRFGQREGDAMKRGLEGLLKLSEWAVSQNLEVHVFPIRKYFDLEKNEEIIQSEQGEFKDWM